MTKNFDRQEGWACPKCGNVYSPQVDECSNCNDVSNSSDNLYPRKKRDIIPEPPSTWLNRLQPTKPTGSYCAVIRMDPPPTSSEFAEEDKDGDAQARIEKIAYTSEKVRDLLDKFMEAVETNGISI